MPIQSVQESPSPMYLLLSILVIFCLSHQAFILLTKNPFQQVWVASLLLISFENQILSIFSCICWLFDFNETMSTQSCVEVLIPLFSFYPLTWVPYLIALAPIRHTLENIFFWCTLLFYFKWMKYDFPLVCMCFGRLKNIHPHAQKCLLPGNSRQHWVDD